MHFIFARDLGLQGFQMTRLKRSWFDYHEYANRLMSVPISAAMNPRAQIAYTWGGEHEFDSGAKGLNARVHLPIKGGDGNVEGIDLLEIQLQHAGR